MKSLLNFLTDVNFLKLVGSYCLALMLPIMVYGIKKWWDRREREKSIKKTISLFLKDIILPDAFSMIQEIPKAQESVRNFPNAWKIGFGMFPTFNSGVLESISKLDVQRILGDDFRTYMNIIGRLNNLQERMAYRIFKEYSKVMNDHLAHDEKGLFDSREQHFYKCDAVKVIVGRACGDLEQVKVIIKELINESNQIVKILS